MNLPDTSNPKYHPLHPVGEWEKYLTWLSWAHKFSDYRGPRSILAIIPDPEFSEEEYQAAKLMMDLALEFILDLDAAILQDLTNARGLSYVRAAQTNYPDFYISDLNSPPYTE